MSNIVQFEGSNSRSKKGKEKAQDRPSNKRSNVWDEFVEIEQPDGTKKAKCLHCGNELCGDSKKGTSHLRRHLDKGCPKKKAKIVVSDSPECHKNHELNECQENHLGYDLHNDQEVPRHRDLAYNQQRNRELFVKMVIDSKTMLKHVENPFLNEFALSLQPLYSPLDQRTVEKYCLTFYENEKAKLKDELSKLKSRVSFSLIQSKHNYCVAAHFIDNNFKLDKRVVGFMSVFHKSIDGKDFLNEWTFGKSVLAFTCDIDLPFVKFVRCILCYLKQIAAIFFYEIYRVSDHIRDMLEKLMQSHEQMSCFNQIAKEHSLPPKAEFELHDERGLGSYFNMFHDAYTYKKVLLELGNTDVQWNVVEEVVGLLKPINDMVTVLSSSECPTINLLVKLVLQVKDVMSNASPVLSSIEAAINELVAKLEKYLASCDEIVHFASLLDPRLKLRFLEYCNGQHILDGKEVLRRFRNLYIVYQSESIEISNDPKYSEHEPELQKYWVSNSVDETHDNFDVLGWWKSNKLEYPILSRMARDILAIPITCSLTSGTEPLKGTLDEINSSRISIVMSEVLVCCNNWFRSNCNYGDFQARTSEEKGQIKMSARREKDNDLCAIVKSENADPKHHLDKARCSNYEGVRVAQGNNFTIAPKECRELLVNMIISSKASFTLLKSSCFIEWARDLQPMYDPNVVSIERDFVGFYQIDRGMLSSFLDKNLSRISLSGYNVHRLGYKYVNVTAHYIDSDFKLVTIIIGMKDIRGFKHDIVKAQLERYIQSTGLNEKVLALTIGIGKSEIETPSELNCSVGEISLQCSTVALFYELFYIIMKYFDMKYFDMKYYWIDEMIEFVGKISNVMQIFSQPASELLDDVRDVFSPLAWKNVETVPCERWKCCVQLFKLICKAAIVLSSVKYPTSHLFLRICFEIHDMISSSSFDFRMSSDHDISDCLVSLLVYLDNFLKKCNKILLIASILDPQFKFAYLKRCYKKRIIEEEEVDEYIRNLCHKYEIDEDDEEDSGMSDEEELFQLDLFCRELFEFELERYEEVCVEIKDDADFDILKWWKDNQSTYPILSRMARNILAIPVCSAPWELAHRMPKWYKQPRFAKSARLLDDCILDVQECSNNKLSTARTNNEFEQGTSQVKKAAIDFEKNIPQSERCLPQVWDIHSISYVEYCLSQKISNDIVVIGEGTLTAEKMRCLIRPIDEDESKNWISNEIINCYIGIIKNQPASSNKVLMLTTFDTRYLESWGSFLGTSKKPDERIWNKIIQKGDSFYHIELVFLPINIDNKHWFVGVLNNSIGEFQILNSLDSVGEPYQETTRKLRSGIQVCIDAFLDSTKVPRAQRPTAMLNWPIHAIPNLPKQEDKSSCGLFALKYMQFWDGSKLTCDFTQYDIHIFRKQLVGELIFSELNEMKDIQEEIKKRNYAFQVVL